jgi:hypothetical protein
MLVTLIYFDPVAASSGASCLMLLKDVWSVLSEVTLHVHGIQG